MLEVAVPKRERLKDYRTRFLDKYRLTKLGYFLRQRRFPNRALNFLVYLVERKRVGKVHYFPVYITLDANSTCNLKNVPAVRRACCTPRAGSVALRTSTSLKTIVDQAANGASRSISTTRAKRF